MNKTTPIPTRAEENRTRRYAGYALGVVIETAAICVIMLVALAIAYVVVSIYR